MRAFTDVASAGDEPIQHEMFSGLAARWDHSKVVDCPENKQTNQEKDQEYHITVTAPEP